LSVFDHALFRPYTPKVPLYEYQCPKCGRFELIRKFSDEPLTSCPTCGKEVVKLASAPSFQFKGTGWYVTDYAKKSSGGDNASSSDKDGSKDSSKDSSKETKDSSKEASKATGSKDASQSPPSSTSKDTPASGSGSSK
jgi:putative FmdB family regulatory protein